MSTVWQGKPAIMEGLKQQRTQGVAALPPGAPGALQSITVARFSGDLAGS
jgi:hypothetical protein